VPDVPTLALEQALTLESGATCLELDRLLGRVKRWLQRDRVEAPIHVHVKGSPTHERSVSFVIDRGGGKRASRAINDAPADCDQLHSAVALSIALAIDASDPNAEPGASLEDLPDDEELLEKPEPPSPPYFRLAIAALGQAGSGVLTDVSWGGALRVEVGFLRWLDLRAGALYSGVTDQNVGDVSLREARFDAQLLSGFVDGCGAHLVSAQFRMLACAGTAVGQLFLQGHGSAIESRAPAALWVAMLGSAEVQAELQPWLALGVSVELVVPLAKHRMVLVDLRGEQVGDARTLLPVGVLVGGGLIFRLF
jgi:hypothetical protein